MTPMYDLRRHSPSVITSKPACSCMVTAYCTAASIRLAYSALESSGWPLIRSKTNAGLGSDPTTEVGNRVEGVELIMNSNAYAPAQNLPGYPPRCIRLAHRHGRTAR